MPNTFQMLILLCQGASECHEFPYFWKKWWQWKCEFTNTALVVLGPGNYFVWSLWKMHFLSIFQTKHRQWIRTLVHGLLTLSRNCSEATIHPPDIIFVTSSTSSASVKYFWICVKLYRINTLTTLLEGKCVKIITQDVSNCKENYTRG